MGCSDDVWNLASAGFLLECWREVNQLSCGLLDSVTAMCGETAAVDPHFLAALLLRASSNSYPPCASDPRQGNRQVQQAAASTPSDGRSQHDFEGPDEYVMSCRTAANVVKQLGISSDTGKGSVTDSGPDDAEDQLPRAADGSAASSSAASSSAASASDATDAKKHSQDQSTYFAALSMAYLSLYDAYPQEGDVLAAFTSFMHCVATHRLKNKKEQQQGMARESGISVITPDVDAAAQLRVPNWQQLSEWLDWARSRSRHSRTHITRSMLSLGIHLGRRPQIKKLKMNALKGMQPYCSPR